MNTIIMKTEYRIKQIGFKYYVQKRKFCIWRNIRIRVCQIESKDFEYEGTRSYWSDTLEQAKRFLSEYKNNYLHSFWCKGRLVKSYYDELSCKFAYVANHVANNHTFSWTFNAEEMVEYIGQCSYERKRKRKLSRQVIIYKDED